MRGSLERTPVELTMDLAAYKTGVVRGGVADGTPSTCENGGNRRLVLVSGTVMLGTLENMRIFSALKARKHVNQWKHPK